MAAKEMMECVDRRRKLFVDALKKANAHTFFCVVAASFFANGCVQQVNHVLV